MSEKKLTHSEMIMRVAESEGDFRPPFFYIDKVKEVYGVTVSNSSVTKSIGKFDDRLRCSLVAIKEHCRRLLKQANNDVALCVKVLRRVANNELD